MPAWLKANGPKYHEAPDELVVPYVEHDARLSWLLYKDQCATFKDWQNNSSVAIAGLVSLELKTTKNLFAMESVGLRLDVPYCEQAIEYEKARAEKAVEEFKSLTGVEFTDSAKCLRPIFESLGLTHGKTELGNASFNIESLLPNAANPIIQAILSYRDANKRASTYWENFLQMHIGGVIYPNTRQSGTVTGRFSVTDPACQTWPDDSEDPTCMYPIRRAFIALDDCVMVSMDYLGMELRFAIDQVEDMDMIDAIVTGADLHQRIADVAGVSRTLGKRGRFLRQYGGGVEKMSKSLGIPYDVASRVAKALDNESPKLKAYSNNLISYAKRAPFGYNWMGRRFFFDKGFEYKYPNYWNQGGCSEILRIAIDDITALLLKSAHPATRFVLPIHDEIILQMHCTDLRLIPAVKQLMVDAYRIKKHLAMDVSVSSGPNMHDLEAM